MTVKVYQPQPRLSQSGYPSVLSKKKTNQIELHLLNTLNLRQEVVLSPLSEINDRKKRRSLFHPAVFQSKEGFCQRTSWNALITSVQLPREPV